MDTLDHLLAGLRTSAIDRDLDGLEQGVWSRIEAERRAVATTGATLRVQLVVAVATLIIGIAIGSAEIGHTPDRQPRPFLSYAEVGPWGTLQAGL